MFEIKRYNKEHKKIWDQFIDNSKNGTFLFKRDYMDYHSDRFFDHSLLIYRKEKLYLLFPANYDNDTLYSHQGLTYGGLIMTSKVTMADLIEVFPLINEYYRSNNLKKVIYKSIPYIYHRIPAQEDLYALFRCCDPQIIGRNISSVIYQQTKLPFIESRKSGLRKAINNNLIIRESNDYPIFWEILDNNLKNKYGAKPVHTKDEITLLASRFPENIKLYIVYNKEGFPIGGTVLYISNQIVHTQYISASIEGKDLGALDLLFDYLINNKFSNYPIFDFGQSTEDMGNILNESLLFQKEGFGGRGVVYDIYKYKL